jgi:hypothetical protein
VGSAMLVTRALFGLGFIVLGVVIFVQMAAFAPQAGGRVIPGIVLAGAMIALGVYRLVTIARMRRPP